MSSSNDRSESAIAVNPIDAYNMVGASKRFTTPATYAFSLAAYATFDGGLSWVESAPLGLPPGAAGTSDPAVAFDDLGNAYLVGLPFAPGTSPTDAVGPIMGIVIYQSPDGGRTWGPPNLVHTSPGDDKQSAVGDRSPTSPYFGNVYAAWDNGTQLAFARTTNHGATWTGFGANPVGSSLATDSFAPEMAVADDGTLYIVWLGSGPAIKFVKSTDGGNSFTAPAIIASAITLIPGQLPGGTFRTFTLPTVATGPGSSVVAAWADYRTGVSRIFFRASSNGGSSWSGPASGQQLLTGGVASAADQHDFHPQLASTTHGEIGCAFYEFGPKGGAVNPLIDVVLAVSTNNGGSFANRVTVTDQPWDPTVAPVFAHGNPGVTFIGDYFGLTGSRLGFFPFWTDTRTGVQEIFTARVATFPADVLIRDSSTDVGAVPSPGNHWESPDLIVRRQPDGTTNFTNQDLLRDGVTDHYIYGKIKNLGPNQARNVRLAVTVGNYPSLNALPGAEFRYPQDWYAGDWFTAAVQARHLFLGLSTAVTINNGVTKIVGPILWPAAQIPPHSTWHPCLLGEARSDNDDSAGGTNGCDIPADPDPCAYGSYFWSNNNVCQRNLSYATVPAGAAVEILLPFLLGSPWSQSRSIEVVVEKTGPFIDVPITLHIDPVDGPRPGKKDPKGSAIEFLDRARVLLLLDDSRVGELTMEPGSVWTPSHRHMEQDEDTVCYGGHAHGDGWRLTHPTGGVVFPVKPGEMRKATLAFRAPTDLEPKTNHLLRVYQRNDRRVITGGVFLEINVVAGDTPSQGGEPDQVAAGVKGRRARGKPRPTRRARRPAVRR